MRTTRATPRCLSDRGTHGLLQLHRGLLQSNPAALSSGVSLAHLLRTGDANRPTVRHPLNRPPKRGNFNFSLITPGLCLNLGNDTGKPRYSPDLRQYGPLPATPPSINLPGSLTYRLRPLCSVFP